MREAPAVLLIDALIHQGATVCAYDPCAMPVAKQTFPAEYFASKQLTLSLHQYDVLNESDALVLVTEWQSFRYPDLPLMKNLMRRPLIIDGRNQYDREHLHAAGFEYSSIGRGGDGIASAVFLEEVAG